MINLTNELVFLTNDSKLRDGILQAIATTRQILFNTYSEGRYISPEDITSTTKREPRTHTMAFCKYFLDEDIFNKGINVSETEFLSSCNGLLNDVRQKRNLRPEDFDNIIPSFRDSGRKISAVFMYQIKRGVQIMLFALWRAGHILLTTNYIMPTTKDSSDASATSLCEPLYSEVIGFFQGFRQKTIQGTAVIKPSKDFTKSLQNTIQGFAWRLVVATDWHTIEDVKLHDCCVALDFLRDQSRAGKSRLPYPIIQMVQMLTFHRPEKLSFRVEDIAKKRGDDSAPLGGGNTARSYIPNAIISNDICEPLTGRSINEHHARWIKPQESYFKQAIKRGKKSMRTVETAIGLLNEFLFSEIPKFKKASGHNNLFPPSPAEFGRTHLDDENFPSLVEHVCKNRKATTAYSYLREIDNFFSYLEFVDKKNTGGNFTNPIIREVDFPVVHRNIGTNKEIISQTYLPALLGYVYALEGLFSYVYHELLSQNETITNIFREYTSKSNTQINTEDLGYCPMILFRKKYIPIKTLPMDIFQASICTVNHMMFFRAPAWSNLIQLIICLETGIRTLHIEWLDIQKYDKELDRTKPLPELVKLFVSTDKVRKAPWTALVSRRVIELLDKQRKILSGLDYSWNSKPIWYDGHEGSVFGKIVPAFPSLVPASSGMPNRDGYVSFFKRIFFSFQEFANENSLFSKKIDWVRNTGGKYQSIISPHSCRATVISHAIHFLPPEIIGELISGHTTKEMTSYYARNDPHFMEELEDFQSIRTKGLQSLTILANTSSVYADDINSALHKAITKNREGAMYDFGATSFERQTSNDKVQSALSVIKHASDNQLAFGTTHICVVNNICTDEVVSEIGENQCGPCWLALKTVDHIPRIDAHIRSLYAQIQVDLSHIDDMISANASKSVIEASEKIVAKKSANLAGWIVSLHILEDMRKDISTRDKFFVHKPDIITQHLRCISTEYHPLTNLLLRVQDATSYPEYLTPELKASMTKFRNMLLARSGNFEQIFRQPNGYTQLDEFRGLIRSVLETTNITITDLQALMDSEMPMPLNSIPLLEIN